MSINNSDLSTEEKQNLKELVNKGKESEKIVIAYTDTLVTALNTRDTVVENEVPNPHPCSLEQSTILSHMQNNDYEDLINCCQRHVCRSEGYCKSAKKHGCRFGYPIEKTEKTHISFDEDVNGNVKANIHIKRNDEFMNIHNRVIAANWRANVDMQVIIDARAAIEYMVKYVGKGEKSSNRLNDVFNSVISHASDGDNPITKLRSLMLKSVGGKRDLGQCEVSRLLLSEPLYSSPFEFVTVSLKLVQERQIIPLQIPKIMLS